jgi:hypothetical protein
MELPRQIPGTRLCIAVGTGGVTLYGNPAALRTMAQYLLWAADADPAEHYECHVRWHLQSDACRFDGKRPLDVWTLVDAGLAQSIPPSPLVPSVEAVAQQEGFEVTFMAVEESDLDVLAQHQNTGLLPAPKQLHRS